METKYNIGDTVLLPVSVGSISIDTWGEITYHITFLDCEGRVNRAEVREKDINGRSKSSNKVSSTNV